MIWTQRSIPKSKKIWKDSLINYRPLISIGITKNVFITNQSISLRRLVGIRMQTSRGFANIKEVVTVNNWRKCRLIKSDRIVWPICLGTMNKGYIKCINQLSLVGGHVQHGIVQRCIPNGSQRIVSRGSTNQTQGSWLSRSQSSGSQPHPQNQASSNQSKW